MSADVSFAAVGLCRQMVEMAVRAYKAEHNTYVHNKKNALCSCSLLKYSTTACLDHMSECAGKLDSWKVFTRNPKVYTAALPGAGSSVFSTKSETIHSTMFPKQDIVHVPEWLSPREKRFIILLLLDSKYQVRIIDHLGQTRLPVSAEIDLSSDTSPPTSLPSKKKRSPAVRRDAAETAVTLAGTHLSAHQAGSGTAGKKSSVRTHLSGAKRQLPADTEVMAENKRTKRATKHNDTDCSNQPK